MEGSFFTFEGGEGSGKSTLMPLVAERLRALGHEVVETREPGGTLFGEKARELLIGDVQLDPPTEALLFAAARRQHLVEVIRPALKRGAIVLCDRFVDSSIVYQGYVRGVWIKHIRDINQFAVGDTYPDLTFYLDIDPEKALARIAANKREVNRVDEESLEFHRQVREGYQWLASQFPNRIVVLDAEKTPDQLTDEIVSRIFA